MPAEITMPQLSDTMTEGTLVKWHKKEGDKVKNGEKIGEVETDKATMEMEAFDTGTMALILVAEGEKAPVGATLAILSTGKEDPAEIKKQYAGGAKAGGEKKPAASQGASAAVATVAKQETREPRSTSIGATAIGATSIGATSIGATPNPAKSSARGDHRTPGRSAPRQPQYVRAGQRRTWRDARAGDARPSAAGPAQWG
jgi:pyruvate dehydrogenase E2 component (dihydrolipoamide acetyltransferase)